MNDYLCKFFYKDDKPFAMVVGVLTANYFVKLNSRYLGYCNTWDTKYPGWRNDTVIIIGYVEPQRNMTKQELCDDLEIPIEHMPDKTYLRLTQEYQEMGIPYKAYEEFVKTHPTERVKNEN